MGNLNGGWQSGLATRVSLWGDAELCPRSSAYWYIWRTDCARLEVGHLTF